MHICLHALGHNLVPWSHLAARDADGIGGSCSLVTIHAYESSVTGKREK